MNTNTISKLLDANQSSKYFENIPTKDWEALNSFSVKTLVMAKETLHNKVKLSPETWFGLYLLCGEVFQDPWTEAIKQISVEKIMKTSRKQQEEVYLSVFFKTASGERLNSWAFNKLRSSVEKMPKISKFLNYKTLANPELSVTHWLTGKKEMFYATRTTNFYSREKKLQIRMLRFAYQGMMKTATTKNDFISLIALLEEQGEKREVFIKNSFKDLLKIANKLVTL